MPILKEVNKVLLPNGKEYPIDICYDLHEPPNANANTPTVVLVSGLTAPLVATNYNQLVYPFVQKGYRVLRFDNRDCGHSTHLKEITPQGMVWDKLKNRMNGANPEHFLTFPLPPDHPLITKDHSTNINQNVDYPDDVIFPGSDPFIFMQDTKINKGCAPYPTPAKGGFFSSIGMGKSRPAYDIYNMAMDTILLCKRLNISTAHFCGVSMGGFIIGALASIKPSMVDSLSFIMTGTGNPNFAATFRFAAGTFVFRMPPSQNATLEERVNFIVETQSLIGSPDVENKKLNNGMTPKEYFTELIPRAARDDPAMARQVDGLDGQESRDYLFDFFAPRIPILAFHGDSDQLLPPGNAVHISKIITNSHHRAVYPPSSTKPEDKKDLEIIEQDIDGRLCVRTTLGNVLPNGRQNYHTLAMLKNGYHELSDDYCQYLVPQLFTHFETARGKVDVTIPRIFDPLEVGTQPKLLYGCPNPTAEEIANGSGPGNDEWRTNNADVVVQNTIAIARAADAEEPVIVDAETTTTSTTPVATEKTTTPVTTETTTTTSAPVELKD